MFESLRTHHFIFPYSNQIFLLLFKIDLYFSVTITKKFKDIVVLESKLFQLRIVSVLEGLSFILLLFVAMPLKYFAGEPIYVKYVGMAHGLLFILFIFALYNAWEENRFSFKVVLVCFVASLLPFAPFFLERKLKALYLKNIF